MEINLEISEWSSNDQFWKTFYKYMFCLDNINDSLNVDHYDLVDHPYGHNGEVQSILNYLQTNTSTSQNNRKFSRYSDLKILDLCCGPGRHCIQFSRYGCKEVTGVDKSPFLLNFGKQYCMVFFNYNLF
jgi:2-polyprenyl-3-methyl-5-hydroxy-6-metoxy-1,4-benzoquinol methylase